MSVALDTNILTRAAQPSHPMHHEALDTLAALRKQGEDLCIVPQNLYEFWVVATRPLTANGLGMSTVQAEAELSSINVSFPERYPSSVYRVGKTGLAPCRFREECP